MVTIIVPEFFVWIVAVMMTISMVLTAVNTWLRWKFIRLEQTLIDRVERRLGDDG